MSTRAILLDDAFIHSLVDAESTAHRATVATYCTLIDGYTAGTDRLFALSDTLRSLPSDARRGLLAPVQTLWVSRQHRSAAKRVDPAVPEHSALILVMLSREKIRTVATLANDDGSTLYDDFDLDVVRVDVNIVDVNVFDVNIVDVNVFDVNVVDVNVSVVPQDEATSITSTVGAASVDTANTG